MKIQITFILFVLISSGIFAQKSVDDLLQLYNTRSIPYVSVEETRMLQQNGDVIILDARELEEYNVSHLKSAAYIGFNDFSEDHILSKINDKDTPIIVYCSLGIRSEEIGEKLKKAGYTNVKNLYGGIFEWKNNEYPIVNLQKKETDSIHSYSKSWGRWLLKGEKVYGTKNE